ncbi:MAG: hypothetical protein K0R24_1231, partial [Gammaproteobacteria bacterium]|nr:hypothetical protein [Gammaproteobacteria bacterium]
INGYDRLTIEARNKLSTYIATDSVIAKQLLDIDQGIEENPDQNKVSALAEQLKSLETALKEFQTICELPGGLLLMEKITHAYQTIALAHIHIAAKNYQENPSSYTREELLLTIESVISAVEKDYKGKKFGNREKYGKPLKAVLDILLKSPTNDKERLELENLSGRLVQVVLYQEQINKMEAAKKEVESNLRMLEEAGITPGESANPATVIIKELNKIREILLESLNPTDDDQRLVVEALKRAASHIPQKLSHLSLTLRIAINNIASKIKAEDGEFEKLLPLEEQVSPLPEFVAAEEEAAGTLGYEIKKFILSKFGSSINERIIAIAGQKFAPDVFFQEIFEGMNKVARQDDRSYDFMKKRIITILKASSMQGKEDSKVEIEATQILDCLKLYDVATTQGKEKSHLSDLTNEELLLSPFNLTLQQLKKYAAPAAIKTIINNYINLIFGNDAGAGFKKVYAIILAESTKQPFPDLAVVLLKLDEILGHKDYFHTPEFRNLLNIYIAVEKYQKCPDRSTQGNLICSLASAFNATEASKKAYIPSFYIKALQEIIQELITIEDDRSYLDTLFNYLDILSKLKTFIEAKGLREEAASAQGQVQVEEKEGEYLQLFALLLTQASMWRPQSSSPVATPLFFHHPHLDPQVVSDSPAAKAIMYEIKRYIESMLEVNSDDDKRFDTALNIMKMPEKDHNKQQKIRKDVFRLEGKVRPKGGYTASQNYQDVRQQYELFYFLKIYIAAENYNLTPSPENYIALMQIPLHLCGQVKASEGDDNNKSPYYLPTLLAIVFLLQDLPSKGGTLNELYEKKEEDRPVFTQKEKDIGKTLAAAENYNLTPLLENHTALMQIPLHLAIGFLLQDLPSDVLTEKDKDILNELYGKREEDRPVFTQEEKDRGKTLADAARKFITNGRNVSNKPAPMQ